MKLGTLLMVTFGLLVFSCKKKDKVAPAATLCDSVNYTYFVKPVLTKSCNIAGCHIGGSGGGGIDLRTYEKAQQASVNYDMKGAINHRLTADKNMPAGAAKLPQRQIDIIECWINKGFPE